MSTLFSFRLWLFMPSRKRPFRLMCSCYSLLSKRERETRVPLYTLTLTGASHVIFRPSVRRFSLSDQFWLRVDRVTKRQRLRSNVLDFFVGFILPLSLSHLAEMYHALPILSLIHLTSNGTPSMSVEKCSPRVPSSLPTP